MTILILIFAFTIGLIIGSFLNVVIYRLPIMMNNAWTLEANQILNIESKKQIQKFDLCTPASTCPHCHHKIKPWQNIPVISFLLLRGKCAHCKTSISPRYPLVELITGLTFLIIAYQFDITYFTLFIWLFTAALIALTFIDIDTQLLPDQITLPLIWLGLIFNLYFQFVPIKQAVLGAVIGYLSLWTLFHLFKLITGKEGMGYGDFKLFAALGAWLGLNTLPIIIFIAAFIGIIISLFMKVAKNQPIAFGPALAISGWLVFIAHGSILSLIHWWLSLSGFSV